MRHLCYERVFRLGLMSVFFIQGAFAIPFLQAASPSGPDSPLSLTGVHSQFRRAFTMLWEPVAQNSDGSALTNLAGYNVYRRSQPRGPAVKINPYLLPVPVYADRIDGQTFYYSVRAVNTNGEESSDSLLIDSSPDINVIFLAQDGSTSVVMPERISNVLRSRANKFGVSLTIRMEENETVSESDVVRHLRFMLVRGDSKTEVQDLAFAAPEAQVKIGYALINGQVALGAPSAGGQSQTGEPASVTNATPEQLALFWHNGVSWIKMGGLNDSQTRTVHIRSSQLGNYQLRIAPQALALSLDKANVFPPLFTPNGDNRNDRVYMILENPQNSTVSAEIFDLSGRFVATLPTPLQTLGTSTTLVWSGTDSSGAVVPSGLYVYRIEGEGKTITGTVAVAR